jgi:hypothetical protein
MNIKRVASYTAFLFAPFLLFSQSQNNTISGTVTDQSRAAIPGVAVTLTNTRQNISTKTTSGTDGLYSFQNLVAGTYDIKFEATGFSPVLSRGIELSVSQLVRNDVRMEVGTQVQQIEVDASVAQLNFDNAARTEGVESSTINQLPLIVAGGPRNSAQFLVLLPGVTTGGGNNSYDARINGGMATGDEAIMDGVSMQEGFMSQSGMVAFADFRMTPDMISEFQVKTSTYEPEYGASSGGQLIAITKSGTAQFHGAAFEYLRNKSLNASQWQIDRKPGDARGKDNEHNFGFNVGGPLNIPKVWNSDKHRTFFFTDWEWFRQRGGANIPTLTVPTAKMRTGDFSEWPNSIFDPTTTQLNPGFNANADVSAQNPKYLRTPFTGNVIPTSLIRNSLALAYFKFLPNANKGGILNNYLPPTAIPDGILGDANHYLIKIDQYVGSKDHFFATIWRQTTPAKFLSLLPLQLASESFSAPQNSWVNRFNYDRTFSATVVNHFAFGYLNRNEGYGAVDYKYAGDLPQIAGVPSHAYPSQLQFGNGYPQLGNSSGSNLDGITTRPTYVTNDIVTWVKGRHTIKIGGEFRAIEGNIHNHGNESGSFYFDPAQTGLPTVAGSGNAMASFLLGAANNGSVALRSVKTIYARQKAFIWHVGDTWKLTNKLSLNYGLRWDKFTPSEEKYDATSFFDFGANPAAGGRPGRLAFAGGSGAGASAGRRTPEDGWSGGYGPRIGAAYGLNDKTVIRAGYGVFYSQAFYPGWGGGIAQDGLNGGGTIGTTGLGGLDPAFYWQNGFPIDRLPKPPFIDPGFLNGQGGPNYRPKDANRLTYSQQWNLTVEHQLHGNVMVSVAYVGNKGTRLPSQLLPLNVLNPSLLPQYGTRLTDQYTADGQTVDGVASPYASWYSQMKQYGCTPSVAQALLPFPQYCGSLTGLNENLGSSTYHAFQLKVEKRVTHGFFALLSYSHSKILTDAAGITQAGSAAWNGTNGGVISPFEKKRAKSLAPDDVPNSLSVALTYELPFGKGQRFVNGNRFVSPLLGGWQLASTAKYSSGTPFWFRSATCGVPGQFRAACIPAVLSGKSPFTTDLGSFDPGSGQSIFTASAFEPVSNFTSISYLGTGPRISDFRGFPFRNVDITFGKRTMIREKVAFIIRAEAFNAFNLHNFTCTGNGGCQAFNTTLGDSNFGKWNSSVSGPRNVQLVGRIEF